MTVTVELLGPVVVRVDGVPVDVGGVRARALLARLALDPGRVVSVDALVEAVWEGSPPAAPANALQAVVSRVRRAVPGLPLRARPPGYLLDLPREAVDAALLEDDPAAAEQRWRGEPLADLRDLAFTAAPAARWAELRLVAAEQRLVGAGSGELPELDRLVAEHPLREGLVALQVRALHRAGRTPDALAAYDAVRRRLADDLGLDPGPALREAHLAVLRDDAPAAPERPPLRTPLTSFRGRTAELDLVAARLAAGRLVTLLGPGGAGKTRLAQEVAGRHGADLPDGVWWVELAPVGEPRQLPAAVLTAVGQRASTTLERVPTVVEAGARLREVFAHRRGLLVLDNCEHLVDAVARLTDDLLAGCPGLVVLTTSREALGIPGEALVPVGPLPVPPVDQPDAADADVVRLFADRARSADPSFVVSSTNLALLLEVCRRLDGMPLALELAAARLRTLGLAQIAARLDDRFTLLTGGSRVALPRQQTLRAVVEWSWESLGPAEQAVGRALSVPPDGVTLDAAEAICGGPDVLDAIAGLVEKSLLTAVPEGDGVRYRMLETVRAYGAEQLDAAGERAATEAAHTAWCRTLLDRLDPLLRGPRQLEALRELRAEYDGLVAALQREVDAGRGDDAVHLAGRLAWFWLLTGQQSVAARLLADVARLPAAPSSLGTVCLTFSALAVADEVGWTGARDALAAVVAVPAELGSASPEPVAVISWALATVFLGRPERLDEAGEHPDPWVRAVVHAAVGLAAENEGRFATLAEDLQVAREAFRALGDRWGMSITAASLGQLAAQDGDLARATELVGEALRCSDELGTSDDSPMLRVRLALLRAASGEVARAGADLDEQLVEVARLGGPMLAYAESVRALVADLAGDLDLADAMSRTAVDRMSVDGFLPPDQMGALVRTVRAQVLAGRGALAEAAEQLDQAQRGSLQNSPDMPVLAVVLVGRAVLAHASGDGRGSARLLGLAEAVRGRADLGDPVIARLRTRLVAELGADAADEVAAAGLAVGRAAALVEVGAEPAVPPAGRPGDDSGGHTRRR